MRREQKRNGKIYGKFGYAIRLRNGLWECYHDQLDFPQRCLTVYDAVWTLNHNYDARLMDI